MPTHVVSVRKWRLVVLFAVQWKIYNDIILIITNPMNALPFAESAIRRKQTNNMNNEIAVITKSRGCIVKKRTLG